MMGAAVTQCTHINKPDTDDVDGLVGTYILIFFSFQILISQNIYILYINSEDGTENVLIL